MFCEASLQTPRRERATQATRGPAGRHAEPVDTDGPETPNEAAAAAEREVSYETSGGFAELLSRLAGAEAKPASHGRTRPAFLHVLWDSLRVSF
jgi:hypothetical protein